MPPRSRRTSDSAMDCATMRSDVIGDFQEPYGAVLVDDMAAYRSPDEAKRHPGFLPRGKTVPDFAIARRKTRVNALKAHPGYRTHCRPRPAATDVRAACN